MIRQQIPNALLAIPRPVKRLIAAGADTLICLASVAVAYYLRLGFWLRPVGPQWLPFIASLLVALPLFISFGFYRTIFRYSGLPALLAVTRAAAIYSAIFAGIFMVIGVPGVPRTLGLIQPLILFLIIGSSRAIIRLWLGQSYSAILDRENTHRVMIYGAGSAGRQLAAALTNSGQMNVVAFIDDDPTLQGSVLNGLTIYSARDPKRLVDRFAIDEVLIALPSATRKRRNEIISIMGAASVGVRTLPGMMDIVSGKIEVGDLRELELEDLLGRDAVAPNPLLMSKNVAGKVVLVTGAGGSIGSELCRQILAIGPAKLLLIEMSEFALYTVHQELQKHLEDREEDASIIVPLLASVTDEVRMDRIIGTWQPDTIYHAAAYKHVPMVEHNPTEGVRNNVFGTLVTALAAAKHGVPDFVLISTDKAVRPTNVMGTSKRVAEMVLQSLAERGGRTRFSMVRFGNVLGSSGSVVPLFRSQIHAGGPITITHRDITRYFMTIPEAAQLVIQAGAMSSGGEVYVLDMGEPVKIIDLARTMVHLSGLTVKSDAEPHGDIAIEEIGLRPGEKLYEELLIGNDPIATRHPRVMKASEPTIHWDQFQIKLDILATHIAENDTEAVRKIIRELVPEFMPERQLVDWIFLEEAAS